MKFVDFRSTLDKETANGAGGIYLFCGEDAYFRESGYTCLKEKFVTQPDMNCIFLQNEDLTSAEKLLGQLYSFPFLSSYRFIYCREFYPKADMLKAMAEYFNKPFEKTIFVILNANSSEQLKKQKNVKYIDCSFESIQVLSNWITSTCKKSGVSIALSTANKICEYTLLDMSRISTETEKLIAYAKGGTIDDNAVDLLVSKDSNFKIYELTDALSKKNFDRTFEILSELTQKGSSEQYIYASIFYHIRKLLHTAINIKKTNAELMEILGEKSDFRVRILKEQAQKFKVSSLKKAYDTLVAGDYESKSGSASFDNMLYMSIFKIMVE